MSAAEAVGARPFVEALPDGFDTDVRKRGGRLSAGQRQLVGLARVVLADPAVVLLDLKLPRVDGLQVLERVKQDTALRQVPVVMLTSSRQEVDVARSYGLGVNAYVVKPVGFPDFVEALRELGLFWAVVNVPPPGSLPRGSGP